jgi:hypothetical protein
MRHAVRNVFSAARSAAASSSSSKRRSACSAMRATAV